jgi:hypothetical protein
MSTQGTIAANSINSDAAWLCLLTFTLPGEQSLRVVNNTEQIVSRGDTFEPTAFEITLPTDDGELLPKVQLEISNVSGEIMSWIRGFHVAPNLKLEIVLSTQPDTVERSIDFLKLTSVDYDSLTISGTLLVENVLSAGYGSVYSPFEFPGLFA